MSARSQTFELARHLLDRFRHRKPSYKWASRPTCEPLENRVLLSVSDMGSSTGDISVEAGIIDWQSFDIDDQETILFTSPTDESRILNRINAHSTDLTIGDQSIMGTVYAVEQGGVIINSSDIHNVTVTAPWDRVDGDVSSIAALIASPGIDTEISLREATQAANNTPGEDIIDFYQYLGGLTLELASELNVTDTLTINGMGTGDDESILAADNLRSFFNVDMTNTPGGSFTLTDMNLQGQVEYAVYANPGIITLDNITLQNEIEPEDPSDYDHPSYGSYDSFSINNGTMTITPTTISMI